MRLMGLDLGDKTIGVAISDPLGLTAQGITTIKRTEQENDLFELAKLISDYEVEQIVLGLPKNMNGSIGPQGEKVLEFKKIIETRFKIDVFLQDERLSTLEAERFLIGANVKRTKRKKVIDKIAAVMILQGFLDSKIGNNKEKGLTDN